MLAMPGAPAAGERPADAVAGAHWAYRPVEPPAAPATRDALCARAPIDRFVLARLESRGIAPSPAAEQAVLARRLWLDLLGLPPPPEEVDRFIADERPDAWERLVDRLLASPRFGERWGRHWLDLARYADSDGYEKDRVRPHAWRYRDWVIDAINRDLPFDRFTIEQLAGDLLAGRGPEARIATGFHRNTLHNAEGGADPEEDRVKKTVDRTNTTGTVWLGLTAGCAQCHDHKYDDLTQREYFSLYAFFDSLEEVDLELAEPKDARAQTLSERAERRTTRVHVRGDFLSEGEEVEPGVPSVLPPLAARGERPDRLDLARWLIDPGNPLTARVAANRIWARLFGHGIVRTDDDLGVQGEPPSHPRLLDHLASELVRLDWSRKALIRSIALSAAYRRSSAAREDLIDVDPENRLLARQNRVRLEAEAVRDVFLDAAGLLDPRIGGPSVRPPLPAGVADLGYAGSVTWPESEGADRHRRGIYIFAQRTVPYPMLATFDAPEATVTCTRRERSNTPLQALALLNGPVFFECAQELARRLLEDGARKTGDSASGAALRDGELRAGERALLRRAVRIVISREPEAAELDRLERTLREMRAAAAAMGPEDAAAVAGSKLAATRGPVEAAAWVAAARVLLNLDDFIVRD